MYSVPKAARVLAAPLQLPLSCNRADDEACGSVGSGLAQLRVARQVEGCIVRLWKPCRVE